MSDEIELHNAETRINPSGHKELVKKKKGKPDEATLNELNSACPGCTLPYIGQDKYCGNCSLGLTGPLAEAMQFAGPLPAGGGAGSGEQPQYDRINNAFNAPEAGSPVGGMEREAGDTLTNMSGATRMAADGPDEQKARAARLPTNSKGNRTLLKRNNNGLDYSAVQSEWLVVQISKLIN